MRFYIIASCTERHRTYTLLTKGAAALQFGHKLARPRGNNKLTMAIGLMRAPGSGRVVFKPAPLHWGRLVRAWCCLRNLGQNLSWLTVILVALVMTAAPARAQETLFSDPPSANQDMVLQADTLIYDQDNDDVIASGNVEIAYGQRILMADEVRYNQITKTVNASGNVSLLEPDGTIIFADEVELTDQFREGFIKSLSVRRIDGSRFTAASATRSGGNITEFNKTTFTVCKPCEEDPEAPPLWQIKAGKIIHNQQEREIEFKDATLEFFGVPVLYLPYLSQPDPSVKRKSGFLAPSYQRSKFFGFAVETPYFWSIAPDKDLTFSPIFSTDQGVVGQLNWRQKLWNGRYDIWTSFTDPSNLEANSPADADFRGHLFSEGRFNISPTWDWGYDLRLVSDETYMRRYELDGATELTSKVFLEGIDGRNYFNTSLYHFQGLLSSDINSRIPTVAPIIEYQHDFGKNLFGLGGRLGLDANAMHLFRKEGADSTRLSADLGWSANHITNSGVTFSPFANIRNDLYYEDGVAVNGSTTVFRGEQTIYRILPTVGVEASFPVISAGANRSHIIEPIAQLIYRPDIGDQDRISNEDSLSFEFDETNLFSIDKNPGLDRWQEGGRANFGLQYTMLGEQDKLKLGVGQSYHLIGDNSYTDDSGLGSNMSDFVGSFAYNRNDIVNLTARARLDKDSFAIERNEISLSTHLGAFTGSLEYAAIAAQPSQALTSKREAIKFGAGYDISDTWRLYGSLHRDLADRRWIGQQAGLRYEDECFIFDIGYRREFFDDRDVDKIQTINLTVHFKTFGGTNSGNSN